MEDNMEQFMKELHQGNANYTIPVNISLSENKPVNGILKGSLPGSRTFNLSSTATTASSSQGSAASSVYLLQPVLWMNSLIAAAKEKFMYAQVAQEHVLPEGHKDLVLPFKKKYLNHSTWETSTAEYAAGAEVAWTKLDTNDGVQLTPTAYNYGVALSYYNQMTNALNLTSDSREELMYMYENTIDTAVRNAMLGTVSASTAVIGAAEMSNTVWGTQTIFGGDATDAANNLDAGDVITTDMIAKARRLLMSNIGYYWSGNTWTKSGVTKNPWEPTSSEPFVLHIAAEQGEKLNTDTQFTNASEYGDRDVILNGQIARTYLGVKIVETSKVPAIASGDKIYVSGSGTATTFDVNAHLCSMVKAKKCAAIAYLQKATLKVFDYPTAAQTRLTLHMAHASKAIQGDSIVRLAVADV